MFNLTPDIVLVFQWDRVWHTIFLVQCQKIPPDRKPGHWKGISAGIWITSGSMDRHCVRLHPLSHPCPPWMSLYSCWENVLLGALMLHVYTVTIHIWTILHYCFMSVVVRHGSEYINKCITSMLFYKCQSMELVA